MLVASGGYFLVGTELMKLPPADRVWPSLPIYSSIVLVTACVLPISWFWAPQRASIEEVDYPGEKQDDGTYLLPYILPVVGGHRAGCASGSTADTTYSIDTHATSPWVSPATEANPALKLAFMTNRLRRGPSIELSAGAYARESRLSTIPPILLKSCSIGRNLSWA